MKLRSNRDAVRASLAAICIIWANTPVMAQPAALSAEFEPHVRPVSNGEVDWAAGDVVAHGMGKARGRSSRDRRMAERGATLVAARNAMAITLGLKVDSKGRLSDVRNGQVEIRGRIKGHRVTSVDWRPNETPPTCHVKMRVPLWGVKGACSVIYGQQSREASRRTRSRIVLHREDVDVSTSWLIIDARGTGIEPCLFPVVEESGGRAIYDVSTMRIPPNQAVQPVRYVETRMTVEELRAWCESCDAESEGVAICDASSTAGYLSSEHRRNQNAYDPFGFETLALGNPPASQPASQPAAGGRRKRRIVRAIRPTSSDNTKIVLTKEDADRLAQSTEGASLLRSGRVVIVVDSVAAGIQGRHSAEEPSILAVER